MQYNLGPLNACKYDLLLNPAYRNATDATVTF